MLIKPNAGPTVFHLQGSAAALTDEGAWEKMLAGMQLLILEPDGSRCTLLADGNPVMSFAVTGLTAEQMTDQDARLDDGVQSVRMSVPWLNRRWHRENGYRWIYATDPKDPIKRGVRWEVREGYPTLLSCSKEQAEKHARAGRDDAKKIAAHYRQVIQVGLKAGMIDEEVARHGMTREGKD